MVDGTSWKQVGFYKVGKTKSVLCQGKSIVKTTLSMLYTVSCLILVSKENNILAVIFSTHTR